MTAKDNNNKMDWEEEIDKSRKIYLKEYFENDDLYVMGFPMLTSSSSSTLAQDSHSLLFSVENESLDYYKFKMKNVQSNENDIHDFRQKNSLNDHITTTMESTITLKSEFLM